MSNKRLENWAVISECSSGYDAPETAWLRLKGEVFGHERHADGTVVTTTRIVNSEKRLVYTRSGSVYELGTPRQDYVDYLAEIGKVIDEENPVKMIKE